LPRPGGLPHSPDDPQADRHEADVRAMDELLAGLGATLDLTGGRFMMRHPAGAVTATCD
jgi:hypothetical protein